MNKITFYAMIGLAGFLLTNCNNGPKPGEDMSPPPAKHVDTVTISQGINSKGIGRFKDVALSHPLDAKMIEKGTAIYSAKCSACHKLTDEKLVGPGWKGVTDRHTPEWIMNFITNTEVMLDKDLAAQAEVVTCLVRMPNQDLTDEQARQILEYMRKNDNKK
jgi:cytochrome c551/c552